MFTTKNLVRQAFVAALYTVLTLSLAFISYGDIQFRIAEVLNLLAFFNPQYILGVTVGCFIANLLGPFGIIDAIIGSLATLIATFIISRMKNIFIASIMPAITNLLVAIEIVILSEVPLFFPLVALQVAIGEIVVVSILGVILFSYLKNQAWFNKLIVSKT